MITHIIATMITAGASWFTGALWQRKRMNRNLTFARKQAQRMNSEPRPGDLFFRYGRNQYIVGFVDGAIACATGKLPPPIHGLADLEGRAA